MPNHLERFSQLPLNLQIIRINPEDSIFHGVTYSGLAPWTGNPQFFIPFCDHMKNFFEPDGVERRWAFSGEEAWIAEGLTPCPLCLARALEDFQARPGWHPKLLEAGLPTGESSEEKKPAAEIV